MRISGTYLETYEKMRLSVSTPAKTIDLLTIVGPQLSLSSH